MNAIYSRIHSFVQSFFFGNYFYGFCAIALSIEAAFQQKMPLNPVEYYIALFSATVLFYTKAYSFVQFSGDMNPRTSWYATHQVYIKISQYILILITIFIGLRFFLADLNTIFSITLAEWALILIFPIIAFLYYGIDITISDKIILRNIGWLKPFVIGFVWTGLVTVYPVLFYSIMNHIPYKITEYGFLLTIKNLMFITMLCVLFDIKDYSSDSNKELKTFVVKYGLRKTIFSFVIPLTSIGLGSFMLYGCIHHFHPIKILLNMVPFILLIYFAYSLHKPKKILYYLILIDGLMFIKAICGSIAMIYF